MELARHKAQIDKKDDEGWSVLFYACREGRRELCRWLLEKNSNAKEKSKETRRSEK